MNPGRNDKLIAIIGVIILIIAGIAIVVYTSPEEEVTVKAPKENEYNVVWSTASGESVILEGKAQTTFDEVIGVEIESPSDAVLTHVDIEIDWKDDKTIGFLLKRGKDTLTAEITPVDVGGEAQSWKNTGGANHTFSFDLYNLPVLEPIAAKDEYEAEEQISISGRSMASFQVMVNVKVGEPFRRPLKRLMDKGNSFELKVYYTYATYHLELEDEGEPPEEPPEEAGVAHIGLIVMAGSGVRW